MAASVINAKKEGMLPLDLKDGGNESTSIQTTKNNEPTVQGISGRPATKAWKGSQQTMPFS